MQLEATRLLLWYPTKRIALNNRIAHVAHQHVSVLARMRTEVVSNHKPSIAHDAPHKRRLAIRAVVRNAAGTIAKVALVCDDSKVAQRACGARRRACDAAFAVCREERELGRRRIGVPSNGARPTAHAFAVRGARRAATDARVERNDAKDEIALFSRRRGGA